MMLCDVCKFKSICKIADYMVVEGQICISTIENKLEELNCDDMCDIRFYCDAFKEVKNEG